MYYLIIPISIRPIPIQVLIYTGISELYTKGPLEYFGTDSKNYSLLKIPSFSKEAASFLANDRGIVGVGLDAPSVDGSVSIINDTTMDPVTHEIFCGANVYILENVNSNLKKLINQTNVRLSSLPLPIETASGSPVRLVAQIISEHSADQLSSQQSVSTSGASPLAAVTFNFILMFVCFTLAPCLIYLK